MTPLGKLDAANRQLDFAIRLLFGGGDAICVHTLAGAASILLTDLVEHHVPSKSWDRAAQETNRLSPSQYFNIIRNAQNFLKHAKSDPAAILNFDEFETEELMMLAVMNSGELKVLSIPQSVYQLWYLGSRATRFWRRFSLRKGSVGTVSRHQHFGTCGSTGIRRENFGGRIIDTRMLVIAVRRPTRQSTRTLRNMAAQRR